MKVRIKKVHPSQGFFFKVGEIVTLRNGVVIDANGNRFKADQMCKCWSNKFGYTDIFEPVSLSKEDI